MIAAIFALLSTFIVTVIGYGFPTMYSCFTVAECEKFKSPFMNAPNRVFNNLLIHIHEYALPENSHVGLGLKSVDPIDFDIVDEILEQLEFDDLQRKNNKTFHPNNRRLLSSSQWARLLHQYVHVYIGDVVALETGPLLPSGHRYTTMGTITGFAIPHHQLTQPIYGFSAFQNDIPDIGQEMAAFVHVLDPDIAVKHFNGTDISKLEVSHHLRFIGTAKMLRNTGDVDCGVFELARDVIPHNSYRDTYTGDVHTWDTLMKLFNQHKNEKYPAICLSVYGVLNSRINVTNFGDILIEIDPKQQILTNKHALSALSGTVCNYATIAGIKDFVILSYIQDNVFQGKRNKVCMDEATRSLGVRFYAELLRNTLQVKKSEL